ncbi:hypothetical protein CY34DRAFT_499832 [Suillus luteus UH-Slu-Lm8-n1]|uniref:Uncharacterized protein n=1 Tax=Suillus luteus UH-Slu-Lm8-n1 TaxID=930992 RepID=A0A0D0AEW5_9AGAM|nr:hypothetical protein CY34DRAFT_499832 [Suillus luteus UH-Slu-Lm8-n1]
MASGDQLIRQAQPCRGACLYVLQLRIFQLHCLRLDPGLDTDSESQNHSRTACRVQACATPQILVSPQWRILQNSQDLQVITAGGISASRVRASPMSQAVFTKVST